MARKKFYLVYSINPPAVDVIREDFLINPENDMDVGADCSFRWEKSKGKFEVLEGKIIQMGLRKDMIAINVSPEGAIIEEKGIGTRKQELEKKRVQQNNTRELQLQNQAEALQDEGADALCEQLQPVVRQPKLPKKRSPEVLRKIQDMLAKMPCYSSAGKHALLGAEKGLYCNYGKLATARMIYRLRPADLHREILKLLIPTNILRLDGVSASGKRGCVAIDSKITEAAMTYVSKVYKEAGGNLLRMHYNPIEILSNLIDNTRKKLGMWRILDTEQNEDIPADMETLAIIPPPSRDPHSILLPSSSVRPSDPIPHPLPHHTPSSPPQSSAGLHHDIPHPSPRHNPSTPPHSSAGLHHDIPHPSPHHTPSTPPHSSAGLHHNIPHPSPHHTPSTPPHSLAGLHYEEASKANGNLASPDHSYSLLDISNSRPPQIEITVPFQKF